MSNLPLTVPRALVFFGLRAAAAILLIAVKISSALIVGAALWVPAPMVS